MGAALGDDRQRGYWERTERRQHAREAGPRRRRGQTVARGWGATGGRRRRGRIGNGDEVLNRQVGRDIGRRQLTGQLAEGPRGDLGGTRPVRGFLGGVVGL